MSSDMPMKYIFPAWAARACVLSVALISAQAGLNAATIDPSRMPASGWTGNVGIPGGIPTNYTMFCNVAVPIPGYTGTPAFADPSGTADSAPAINYAIQHCPNNEYVYIPTGNYYIGSTLSAHGTTNYNSDQHPYSIEIKGDGPALTKLYFYGSGGSIFSFQPASSETQNMTIASGDARGSTSLTLTSFTQNGYNYLSMPIAVEIQRINSDAITPTVNGGVDLAYESNTCSQIVEVTAINNSTNTITFSPALNEGYPNDYVTLPISAPYRSGIQDLYIENMTNNDGDSIAIYNGQECWVKNVESNHSSAYHIRLASCVRCEVRQCYLHNAWWAGGNEGYGCDLNIQSCNNLVEDNVFYFLRHAMPMEVGGQGNVYAYNYNLDPINSDEAPSWNITSATNASPIEITTSAANTLETGDNVTIQSVGGNTAANGSAWFVTVIDSTHFTLNNSVGNGTYSSGSGQVYYFGTRAEDETDYLMGDQLNHGGEPRWNLREGNVAATIKFDCVLGGSAYDTLFRNQIQRKSVPSTIVANFGSDIQTWNYYHNLSGNVYETAPAGHDPGLRRWGTDQDNTGSWTVSNASNTSPIIITTSNTWNNTATAGDYLYVTITGVKGNTAANVTSCLVRYVDSNDFSLVGTTGNGTYTSGGTVAMGIDPLSQSSAIVDGEYDFSTGTLTWVGSDQTLPNSYYLTAKPTFFGNMMWPAVDPTHPQASGTTLIPAGNRFATGLVGQPANFLGQSGGTATFAVNILSGASLLGTLVPPTLQWQVSIDGGNTWSNLSNGANSNGGTYSGVTTATLTVANVSNAMSNYEYQCVATGASGGILPGINANATSYPAVLIVTPPPVITSGTTASATTGSSFTYTITATNSPTSYGAAGLPSGLSINTTTGVISGTPTTSGIFNVTITATNAGGTNAPFTLSLTVTQPKPVINSSTTATATVNSAFSYTITATNSPTSYNATGLPSGLTVNTTTGAISGTPTASGNSSVSLSATNSGGTGTATLSLTVNGGKPVITSATTATANKGSAFSYTITATNSPTSYSATGLPAGLTVKTSTGVISGTPTATGSSTVTIGATNASGTGTATLSLTVNASNAPVINSATTATATKGSPFSYTITATNSPTSYSATGLPAGLTVNTSTGVISGTPTATGTSSVKLGATNASGTGSATLSLTVSNQPIPVITSATSAGALEGSDFSYTITATNSPTSYSATGLPSGLSINTATGVISGTPSVSPGTVTVHLGATNSGGTGTATLSLSVANDPVIATQPASQTVNAGSSVVLTVSAVGNSTLSYQWYSGASPISGAIGPMLSLGTVQTGASGSTYSVKVTDNAGTVTSNTATLTVTAAQASSIAAQPQSETVNLGSTTVLTVTAPASSTYQWEFNGINLTDGGSISGSTGPQLVISGTGSAAVGDYTCMVTTAGVSTQSNSAAIVAAPSSNPGIATSISARAFVGTGDNILIGGFYIVGSTSRTVLIQALGPALTALGVSGALQHPTLSIHQNQSGQDVTLYSNTGWGGSQILLNAAASVFANPVLVQGSADSELLLTLPPGGYSAEISGANSGTGVALCAIYELP
jgi:hypothetical protein